MPHERNMNGAGAPEGAPVAGSSSAAEPAAGGGPPRRERRFANSDELREFVDMLGKYERGEIDSEQFRVYRLTRGVYGQRQDDVQMLRVKIPQGILSGDQLRTLARVAREFSRGFGHVTTRQNVQFHFVKMAVVPRAQTVLAEAGLTMREACGNTVRNITACPIAGVCPTEPFDVTPYGEALTRFFLRNPICQALPRKFKIALSGCPDDCAKGAFHDIGISARTRQENGRTTIGFKVVIGGGLAVSPQNAWVLHEFLPPDRLLPVCEAVVRVFDRTGNRKNKAQARMKYAIRKLGWETFRAEVEKELQGIPATRDPETERYAESPLPGRPEAPTDLHARIAGTGSPEFRAWAATNSRPQRQPGYSLAFVTLPRGDLTADQFEAVARIAETRGEGSVRTTIDQNLALRWIRTEDLPLLHGDLVAAGLGAGEAGRLLDPTSCPGAESCKIAVTGSRELALALKNDLQTRAGNGGRDLIAAASDLTIKISGCPNSCGQHHVAGIGFHGAAKNVGERAAPAYLMLLGGGVDAEGAHFGRRSIRIPARRVPDAVGRLLTLFQDERQPGETAPAFFRRVDLQRVNEALADLASFDAAHLTEDDYRDLGMDVPFQVEMGEGECAT